MKNGIYKELNESARWFFEYKIKQYYGGKLEFEEELDSLCKKNILFIFKMLYDFVEHECYYPKIKVYGNKIKGELLFLDFLKFDFDNSDNEYDLIIEMSYSNFLLNSFINHEYDGNFDIINVDEDNDIYMLVPRDLGLNPELKKVYTNMKLKFNDLSVLRLDEKYEKYKDMFIFIRLVDNSYL